MSKHSVHTIIIFSLLVQSCAPIKYPKTRSNIDLEKDLPAIDGDYWNLTHDTINSQISIWGVLTKNYNYPAVSSSFDYSNSFVRLTAQDDNRVMAQLYVDSTLTAQKVLKGRVKGSYFVLRRKVKWYGLPFVFLWYSDYKLQLSKDRTRNLYIDGINGRATWILIFGGGSNDGYNFKFSSK